MRYFKSSINKGYFLKIIFCVLMYIAFDIVCPIKKITGVCCPTCGMTTAWLQFLRGNVTDAFMAHRLFLLAPLLVFACCMNQNRKKDNIIILSAVILLVNHLIGYI